MLTILIVYLVVGLVLAIIDGVAGRIMRYPMDPILAYVTRVVLWPLFLVTLAFHGIQYYRTKRRIKQ